MTEYLNSHGLLETFSSCPECMKKQYFALSVVIVQECKGPSKGRKQYTLYDIEHVKWLHFQLEKGATGVSVLAFNFRDTHSRDLRLKLDSYRA